MADGLSAAEVRALAEQFSDPLSATQLLEWAGLPRALHPWGGRSAEQFWHEVSRLLQGGVPRLSRVSLLVAAATRFPDHEVFASAVARESATRDDDRAGHPFGFVPRPRTAETPPSLLLRPEYAVVPFVELAGDRAALRSWVARPEACSVRLLAGQAGSGKTRLGMGICEDLADRGWLTLLVDAVLSPTQLHRLGEEPTPVLVAVDNAELRLDEVTAIATALANRAAIGGPPSRLLLLTRSTERVLRELRDLPDSRVAKLFRSAEAQLTTPLAAGADARHMHFNAAYAAFRAELRQTGPVAGPPLPLDGCQSVLDVHAAALNVVLDETRPSRADEAPLVTLSRHDRRRWGSLGREGDGDLHTGLAARIRTLTTLLRPGSLDDAEALSTALPGLLGLDADAERVRDCQRALGGFYLARWAGDPIRPDAYGEHLAAAALAADPSAALAVAATGTIDQVTTALTVLGRALPRHPALTAVIAGMIRRDPNRLVLVAADVAARLPDPELFTRTVSDAVDDSVLDPGAVFGLSDRAQHGGAEQDPLLGLFFRSMVGLSERMRPEPPVDVKQDPGLAALTDKIGKITKSLTDLGVAVVDPTSGRMPANPDGTPVIPPENVEMLRALRRIWADNRRADDQRSEDDQPGSGRSWKWP
ncbi:effector-associated domain EAD1-containing protein [Pseudofrankia saprophytica]|uniref:effector-associated domain EAD1-containing protein n=1 Tax=Pseudofrankia saprophytica TaxID=298655 RepID=UPI000234D65C|nr:effector-associated domain EAD1-containing protein [Pseudofrankia saprophytica]